MVGQCEVRARVRGGEAGGSRMAGADELLATIEAIYAAGLDGDLWPQALAAVTQTFGGISAMVQCSIGNHSSFANSIPLAYLRSTSSSISTRIGAAIPAFPSPSRPSPAT